MWIMTTAGFYSVVAVRHNTTQVMVRARSYGDISNLAEAISSPPAEIIETFRADYPYRIVVNKSLWADWLVEAVHVLDYPNFKSHIEKQQGIVRHDLYTSVWAILRGIESEDWPEYEPDENPLWG